MLLASLSVACSSEFIPPASDPRIAVTIQNGQPTYVREGKSYAHGLLGGGLVEATRGVPAAEAAANTYHSRSMGGFAMMLGGLAAVLATPIVIGASNANSEQSIGLLVGGLSAGVALSTAGSLLTISAIPYQWDAINLYNHDVNQRPPPMYYLPPGYLLPGTPPAAWPPVPPASSAPPSP